METEQVVEEQEPLAPTGEEESPALVAEKELTESTPVEEPTPEVKAGAPVEEPPDKVQKRIDEITWKKSEAERERDYWRGKAEALTKPPEPEPEPVIPTVPQPRQEDFETYEQYDEALFDWRYQQRVMKERAETQKEEAKRQAQEFQERANTWAEEGSEKYPDFATVALKEPRDGGPMISQFMAGAIQDSEMGHEIAYYLGQNVKEAARIAKLPPIAQVREIGRLEFKVTAPKIKDTTQAPAPTAPVGGKESPSIKPEDMTYEEYKAYRNKQLQARGG